MRVPATMLLLGGVPGIWEINVADDRIPDAAARKIALALVEHCVRDTELENLHAGITPDSLKGDYSDVKVVTPYGEIPWTQLSRISDAEMKTLMKEIVNKVFTFITHLEDLAVPRNSVRWDRPEHDAILLRLARRRAAEREGTGTQEE